MVVSAAPDDRAGTVSAVQESGAELGGAIGIALLGSVSLGLYRAGMAAVPDAVPPGAVDAARETLAGALSAADGVPGPAAAALAELARDAFLRSYVVAEGVAAALVCATAVAFWTLPARRRAARAPGT
jgi:DHA2 family multidrug resistance protein-like MFS transporter